MTETMPTPQENTIALNPLTEADKEIIVAFLNSSIKRVYLKVMNNHLIHLYQQLEKASDQKEIFQIQGGLQTTRYLMNLFDVLAQAKLKKDQASSQEASSSSHKSAQTLAR